MKRLLHAMALLCGAYFLNVAPSSAQVLQVTGTSPTTPSSTSAYPVSAYHDYLRAQHLYTAAELTAAGASAGKIYVLGWEVVEAPSVPLPNYQIRMRHTSASNANAHDAGTMTTVYSRGSYTPAAGGYDMLVLDTPFEWNGVDNILIDVCYGMVGMNSSTGRLRASYTPFNSYRWLTSSADACNAATSSRTTLRPHLQLSIGGQLADEVAAVGIDASACVGSNTVTATVANLGSNPVTSLTLQWRVNGIMQPPVSYNTLIDTLGGASGHQADIVLGAISSTAWGELLNIEVWTTAPNANIDPLPSNDTAQLALTTALGGTYQIGGGSPDFTSLQAAFDTLMQYGVCSDVTLSLAPGTYSGQSALGAFANAGGHTVTITSSTQQAADVRLSATASFSDNYTLRLADASHVALEHLTLQSLNTVYGTVLDIRGNADHIAVRHCTLQAPATNSAVLTANTGTMRGLEVRDSRFYGGGEGLEYRTSLAEQFAPVTIVGNTFYAQRDDAIRVTSADVVTVEDNYISGDGATSSYIGIYVFNLSGSLRIAANRVVNAPSNYGIYLGSCVGRTDAPLALINNYVHTRSNGNYGIFLSSVSHIRVDHNTIAVTGGNANARGLYVASATAGSVMVRNNVFQQADQGTAIYAASGMNQFGELDYNNYYTTGTAAVGYEPTSGTAMTLADWRGVAVADSHSLAVNPFFLSDTSYVINQAQLDGAGTALGESQDIEGNARDLVAPDMGAYAFSPMGDDAGLTALVVPSAPFAVGVHPVQAILQNNGGNALSQVSIDWSINGVAQSPVNWSGSLAAGDTAWVTLGLVSFGVNQGFAFAANTRAPNGAPDLFTTNDSAQLQDVYAGLLGAYTIGASGDFPTLTAAATQLNFGGVLGAVELAIASGAYAEQVLLTHVPGASMAHPITWRSAANDADSVQWTTANNTFAANYALHIEHTPGVVLEAVTLQSTATGSYRGVLYLSGASDGLVVRRCVLRNAAINSSSTNYALVNYAFYHTMSAHRYEENAFENGSYAVYNIADFSTRPRGFAFAANAVTGTSTYGVYLQYLTEVAIDSNVIDLAGSFSYGISLLSTQDSFSIVGNAITQRDGYGIYLSSSSGLAARPGLIANNYVFAGGTSGSTRGLYLASSSRLHLYHNTVQLRNTSASSAALYLTGGSNIQVRNNIFASTAGYAFFNASTSNVSTVNHNLYHATGGNPFAFSGTAIPDFATWRATSGQDAQSIFEDPLFESDSTATVNNVSANASGTPLAQVPFDIDGELRDATTPDIGADEFEPAGLDAGIAFVAAPPMPFAAGLQPVYANLKNFGADTLTSVTLQWRVNDTLQPLVFWTGTLATGDTTSVLLGSYDFYTKQLYRLSANAAQPNGGADVLAVNDTASLARVTPAFNGIYTLGGANSFFTSFNDAAQWLTAAGVVGAVTIEVRDGVYNEQVSFGEVAGASLAQPILIRSERQDTAAVHLTHLSTLSNRNYTLRLAGTDAITFQHLTLVAQGNSRGRVVELDSLSANVSLLDCAVVAPTVTTTSTSVALLYFTNGHSSFGFDSLTLARNTFTGGGRGLYLTTNGLQYSRGITIRGNAFYHQYGDAIYLVLSEDIDIQDNLISTGTHNVNTSMYGVYMSSNRGLLRFTGNRISGRHLNYGLYLTSSNFATGSLIANNFFQTSNSASSTTSYPLYLSSVQNVTVAHNATHVLSTSSNAYGAYFRFSSGMEILNNNFVNGGGGVAAYYRSLNSSTVDYNNLFSVGANLATHNSTSYIDLASLQAASGFETHALSIDPLYADSADLHISNILLDRAGTPVAAVTVDIDGEARNASTPDIGADEFSTDPHDAGIAFLNAPVKPFAAGSQPVRVRLVNNGTATLDSVRIDWTINGSLQPTYVWRGSLASGSAADSIAIGSFNFAAGIGHTVQAWVTAPNGSLDADPANDTLTVTDLYPALDGTYTIGGTTPDFATFGAAVTALERGGIVGAVTFEVRAGVYSEQVRLPRIDGTALTQPIVFQSETGNASDVTLTAAGTAALPYTLLLDGAQWTTFRNMTLVATGNDHPRVVALEGSTMHCRLEDNRLLGSSANSASTRNALCYVSSSMHHEGFAVVGNTLEGGSYGMYYFGYLSGSRRDEGLVVESNTFIDQFYRGVMLSRLGAVRLRYNTIAPRITATTSYTALYLNNLLGATEVSYNQLNTVAAPIGQGLYLWSVDGTAGQRARLFNNFVQSDGSWDGIYMAYADYLDVAYNTVSVPTGGSTQAALYLLSGGNLSLENNILAHEASGIALKLTSTSTLIRSDHNNLYTTGAVLIDLNGTPYATLGAWQSATALEAQSLSVDPNFVGSGDLHVAQPALDSAAIPIAGITDDLDGDIRHATHPDIGADEFAPAGVDDLGITNITAPVSGCGLSANAALTVTISNFGAVAASGFDVTAIVDDTLVITENVGALSVGAANAVSYTFAERLDLSAEGAHRIQVFTTLAGDANATNDTTAVTVTHFAAPTVTFFQPSSGFCAGDTRTITASGGVSYSWNVVSTGASITVSPLATTTYYVTVTDANGCVGQDSVTVVVHPLPTAFATNGGPYCDGQTVQLQATGGLTYQWSGPNAFAANVAAPTVANAVALDAGRYYVTVTDANGCTDSASTQVVVQPCAEICNNGIDDDNDGLVDCQDGDCHNAISLSALPSTTLCAGETVGLFATGGVAYLWSTGAVTPSIPVNVAGTYSVTITSSSGCDSTMSVTITARPLPVATASNTGPYCIGADIALSATGGTSYEWSGPDGFTANVATPTVSGSTLASFGWYYVTVTDAAGCRGMDSTEVMNTGNAAPVLAYSGGLGFANSVVSPLTGDPYTRFRFEVLYTDADGDFPDSGEPKVWMDAEGNGSYFNANDRVFVMQEADPTDVDVTDGKLYVYEALGLPISEDWETEVRASDGRGCAVVLGAMSVPDVLNATDVSIFANDITFSDDNPAPGDTITISTVVHNFSSFDAAQFVVRLLNQRDSTFQEDTVSVVPAGGAVTLQWTFVASDTPSYNPIQVILDVGNVINEPNELDNTAVRPLTVGNFVVGGEIITRTQVSPAVTYTRRSISLTGNAVYTDLAVTLQDSSVAGATVMFSVFDTLGNRVLGPYSTYTNSRGDFSYAFYQSLPSPARYDIIGYTTDFTLQDTFQTSFELLPEPVFTCLPDLTVGLTMSDNKVIVGNTLTGTAIVYNSSCDTVPATQLFIELPAGVPVPGPFAIPTLLPGQSHTVNLGAMTFNTLGQTYIRAYADHTNVVVESSEGNNTATRTITVLPPLPDLVAKSFGIGTLYSCTPSCVSFLVRNDGGVASGDFDAHLVLLKNGMPDTVLYQRAASLDACQERWLSFCYTFSDPGAVYNFRFIADSLDLIAEFREDNNEIGTNRSPVACQADLSVTVCRGGDNRVEAFPVDAGAGDRLRLRAEIYNSGNLAASNFDVRFRVVNNAGGNDFDYFVNYNGTLNGGQRDTVSVIVPAGHNTPLGDNALIVTADVNNVVTERSENNNSASVNFCYDFRPEGTCGTDFWERVQPVFQPVPMVVKVKNLGILDASAVQVRFEVRGPGIPNYQLIGQSDLVPAYSNFCASCSDVFVLGTPYAFQQVGTYQVRITVDGDGRYTECDESNNVLVVDVEVAQVPDMRVLSQFINPSLLNPEPGQPITFDVTYENIGVSNVGDSMKLFLMVDEVPLDSMRVGGLTSGDFSTVNFATPWSSTLVGAHVARIIIDKDDEISESNELNNEATRVVQVGQLPDLFPSYFATATPNPTLNSATLLEATIQNGGDTACVADVQFYYVNANLDTLFIGSTPIAVGALDSVDLTFPWNSVVTPTTLVLRIVNADPQEARTDNNTAFYVIGEMSLTVVTDADATCAIDGQATATAVGGNAPYTYNWSNGATGAVLTAPAGVYSVTVTDQSGETATAQAIISSRNSIIASYSLSDTCAPVDLALSATSGAATYRWIGPNGFISYSEDTLIIGATTAQSGIYTLTATFPNGCTETTSLAVALDSCCTTDTTYITGFTCLVENAGTYVNTFQNQGGCDSLVYYNLTFAPPIARTDTLHYCTGDTAYFEGIPYTSTIQFTRTFAQVNSGCDSLVTTVLQFSPTIRITQVVTLCAGERLIVGDSHYTMSGTYTDTLTSLSANGCDSVITTILTVLPPLDSTQVVTLCAGERLIVGDSHYTMSGTYTDTLTSLSANGCDSVITTILTVLPPLDSTQVVTLCAGERLIVGDSHYTMSGTYTDTLTSLSANGCDSVVTTVLTILPADTVYLASTTCDPALADTYVRNFTNAFGCDSTVIETVTLLPSDTIYLSSTTCDPALADTYVRNFTNAFGCDSTVIETVALLPSDTTYLSSTTCDSSLGGVFATTFTNASGCDSIVIETVTLLPSDTTYLMSTTCDPALADTYVRNFTNVSGCDSTVIETVTLLPSDTTYLMSTTCDPALADTYVRNFTNASGCDSTVIETVTLLPSDTIYLSSTTCDPTLADTYVRTFTNASGCDSTVIETVTLLPSDTTYLMSTTCDSSLAGVFATTFTNAFGCDSTVIETVTLLPSDTTYLMSTTCDPALADTYVRNFTNVSGCDSTVIETVTLLPSDTTYLMSTTCDPALADTYVRNFTNASGCDSTVIETVTLLPSDTIYLSSTTCDPTLADTYVRTFTNASGCDSTVIETVTLLPSDTTYLMSTTCDPALADTYVRNFTNAFGCDSTVIETVMLLPSDTTYLMSTTCDPALADTYVRNFTNASGCDSTVIETVTLLPSDTTYLSSTTCDPALADTYVRNFTNASGCDSTVIETVTLLPSDTTYLMSTTCDPALADTYVRTFTNASGCDSTVIETVTLLPSDTTYLMSTTCDPALADTYVRNFTNAFGCDSTVIETVTLLPSDTTYLMSTTCDSSLAGVFTTTFTNVSGCDSTVIETVTLLPSDTTYLMSTTCDPALADTYVRNFTNASGCDSTVIETVTLLPSDTTYLMSTTCDSSLAGVFATTLVNSFGCDSTVIETVTLLPSDTTYLSSTTCDSSLAGVFATTLVNAFGCDSTVIETVALLPSDTIYLSSTTCDASLAGVFATTFTNASGCDSTVIETVALLPSDTTYLMSTTCDPALADTYVRNFTNVSGCDSTVIETVTLLPGDTTYLSSTTCDSSLAGVFATTFTNAFGCDSTVIETVTLLPSDTVYLSSATCDSSLAGVFATTFTNVSGCDSTVIETVTLLPSDTTYLMSTTCDPALADTYVRNFTNASGCDSTVIETVTLLPSDTTYLMSTTCDSSLAGVFATTFTNVSGCDSTVIETVTLLPSDTIYLSSTTCDSSLAGVFATTFTNVSGCDSTVIETVTLLPSDTTYLSSTTCDSSLAGVFATTFTNAFGCDSTVIETVTLLPSDTVYLSSATCDSSLAGVFATTFTNVSGCDSTVIETVTLLPSDTVYLSSATCDASLAGVFATTFTNASGCDSTVIETVTLLPSDTTYLMSTTCDSSLAGVFATTLVNAFGCDSTVIETVTLLPSDTTYLMSTTCDPALADTYVRNFTNASGCDSTVIETVTLLPQPTITTSTPNVSICAGDSVQLAVLASTGTALQWLPSIGLSNDTVAQPLASPTVTTTYTVIATLPTGCSDTTWVTVVVHPRPSVSVQVASPILCNGNTNGVLTAVVSGGTPPFSYAWNTGVSGPTMTGLGIGTYTVTVTDANGCTVVSSRQLTQPNVLRTDSIMAIDPGCNVPNGSIALFPTGGTTPYQYTWSNGDTTASLQGLNAGTYGVTITDANGCTITRSVTLNEQNTLAVQFLTQNVDCSGDSTGATQALVTGGVAPYQYAWSNGDTTAMLSDLFAGYYFLTVTDANGCQISAVDTVTSPTPITLGFQQVLPNCYDSTGVLTVNPQGGIPPYQYRWSTGDSTATASGLPQGNYQVTVTDANGCERASTSIFLNGGLPVADFTITVSDSAVIIDDQSLNVLDYLWDFGNGDTSALIEPIAVYTSPGTYTITLVVSNSCGSDTITGTVIITTTHTDAAFAESIGAVILPNPNQGAFLLDLSGVPTGAWQLEVLSITGQRVFAERRIINQPEAQLRVTLPDVGSGLYLLRMTHESGGTFYRKVLIDDER